MPEKDRDLRYQHASEIRSDLKRLKRDTDSEKVVAVEEQDEKPTTKPVANWPIRIRLCRPASCSIRLMCAERRIYAEVEARKQGLSSKNIFSTPAQR
jgi:hypothetical protein